MYREDLDELVAKFQRGGATVMIYDNENRYDSLEEMKQHMKLKGMRTIKALYIRSENPGVNFLFDQRGMPQAESRPTQYTFNELRTEEVSAEAANRFYAIKDFLNGFQRPHFRRLCIAPAIISLAGVFWFGLHNQKINSQGQPSPGSPIPFAISLIVFLSLIAFGMFVINSLKLESRHTSTSFFDRNRDDLAKDAIKAAIGGAIGWILGHFVK
jgi:hypothetical protein